MFGVRQILVSPHARRCACAAAALALLTACGQKGPLYMPTEPAAAGRATLPQTLQPAPSTAVEPASAPIPPRTGTAAPVRNP